MVDFMFNIPEEEPSIIKVIGIGGGGGNAIKHMFKKGLRGVDFIACDTDLQDLESNPVKNKILLGETLTEGKGAGNKPLIGEQAAIESLDSIQKHIKNNTKLVIILAGMGGGTGTGATPIIAKEAKSLDILTIAIITIPFKFEGVSKYKKAIKGIENIKETTDGLMIINNEILKDLYKEDTLYNMLSKPNKILLNVVKGIAEIINIHGHTNLDLADLQTVVKDSGLLVMGYERAKGENRAIDLIRKVIHSPILSNINLKGAKNILINFTYDCEEIYPKEIVKITSYVKNVVGNQIQILLGTGRNEELKEEIAIMFIATKLSDNEISDLIDVPQIITLFKEKEIVFDFEFSKSKKQITPDMEESLLRKYEKYPAYSRYKD